MSWFNKKQKENPTDQIKEQETNNIVDQVKSMYEASYQSKAKLHEKWKKCRDAYTGELFKLNLPEHRSDENSNYIFSTIETIKPIMLSSKPKVQVIPRDGSYFEKSRIAQYVLDSEWDRSNMFRKLGLFNHLCLIYGTAIMGNFWNSDARNGLGDVESVLISPFNFFLEPTATTIQGSEYAIYAVYKKTSEICKAFPEKAEEIKKQATSEVDKNLMIEHDGDNFGKNNILYIECYMHDYSCETYIEEEEDENGNKHKYEVKKRKYPNGRRVLIAGDTLLSDGENPYQDGAFPFVANQCYPQAGTFWGIGEVEMLISPQKSSNRIMNGIIENAMLNGNPWTIMDSNAGIEKGSLSNKPGLVLRKRPGTEVRREAPPPIPAYLKDVVDTMKIDMQEISGVFDVVKGERPGSVTAASAIQALNEQAQGRIRMKVQFLEGFISELGSMWLRRIQQFWETSRTVRVAGQPIQEDFEGNQILLENGTSYRFIDITKDAIDGDYDIEVSAGSTMQSNKSAIAQIIIQLAQTMAEDGKPMINRKTVLENMLDTIPNINVQQILDFFEQSNMQEAEAQQAQTETLKESEMMKMDHETELQQMKQDHEVGIKNMEHASKTTVEDMKEEQMNKQQKQQKNNNIDEENISSGKSLQNNKNNVEYKEKGNDEEELEHLVEYLASLSDEEYTVLLNEHPELAQLVDALLGGEE